MIIVQHTILTSKLNSRWRACQVSETVRCDPGQAASVNMTLISHRTLVYYNLHVFTTVLLGDMSHFQTSGTFTKKPYKKGSQRFSSWFSCTFCPDFVDLYNKPVVKKVYRSWLRVQNKFLPNEGCLRMFSLLIKDPPSNPRPPTPPYIRYLACEQALLFGQAKRA